MKYDLVMELSETIGEPSSVTAAFYDVVELKCSMGLGGWSQFQMLGIREIHQGWEEPYVVEEIEDGSIRFRCKDAKIISKVL
jgi:hypothetical protein